MDEIMLSDLRRMPRKERFHPPRLPQTVLNLLSLKDPVRNEETVFRMIGRNVDLVHPCSQT